MQVTEFDVGVAVEKQEEFGLEARKSIVVEMARLETVQRLRPMQQLLFGVICERMEWHTDRQLQQPFA